MVIMKRIIIRIMLIILTIISTDIFIISINIKL